MRTWIVLIAVLVVTAQGCETMKGAGHGVKKDAENTSAKLQEWDAWMTEHMW